MKKNPIKNIEALYIFIFVLDFKCIQIFLCPNL